MEDIKTASTRLILSSTGLILFLGGWASFADTIPVGSLGLKLTSLHIAPIILIAFWAFSWQRFFVLSLTTNKPKIDAIVLDKVNETKRLARAIFPPETVGIYGASGIVKWNWHHPEVSNESPFDHIVYKRLFGKRLFMFYYIGNDINNESLHVHIGPVPADMKNGVVTPLHRKYWKCIWFEIQTLVPRFFDTPIIGFHYFPHIFAWATLFYMLTWGVNAAI